MAIMPPSRQRRLFGRSRHGDKLPANNTINATLGKEKGELMDYKNAERWLAVGETTKLFFRFFLTVAAIAAPFGALWVFSDSLPLADEITVYTAYSDGEREGGTCIAKEHALSKRTYKALVDQQMVINWRDGNAPESLTKCAVRNARNWSCESSYGSVLMVDGAYHDPSSATFYQVPKWYWWWLKATSGQKICANFSFSDFLSYFFGLSVLIGVIWAWVRVVYRREF
jgi:hypothetical protein